jgi:hypothetical protein
MINTATFVRNIDDLNTAKNLFRNNKIDLNSSLLVLWDNSMAPFFKEINSKYAFFEEYGRKINFNRLRKTVMDLVKTFPHKKISDNKSLIELLSYRGFSLWWFIRQGFYADCIKALKEVYTLKLLLKQRKIKEVTILNQDREFLNIIKEAAKGLSIRTRIKNKKPSSKKFNVIKNKKETILDNLPRLIRVFQGFLRYPNVKKNTSKKNILFTAQSQELTPLYKNTIADPSSYMISEEVSKSKDYNPIILDIAVRRDEAWRGIKESNKSYMPYDYFVFKSYFDPRIQKNLKPLRAKLTRVWNELSNSKKFRNALYYNGIDFYNILKYQMRNYFTNEFNSLISAARNLEIGIKLLDDCRIDGLIAVGENEKTRFLIFAAKKLKIPSIGLQHGMIEPLRTSPYNYNKNDLCGYNGDLNCQLADKTALFGPYYKQIFLKSSNYPKDKIVVTGQQRMDMIFENRKHYSRKKFYKQLGIDAGKKLVVYASQAMGDESRRAFSALVKSLKQIKNVSLVIKLHTADDKAAYEKILQDLDYNAVIIKYIDLYELLNFSDLLVSIQSTVILEALALEKPVIQLNLVEKYDVFGKLADKCIMKVTNENELPSAIKQALHKKYLSKRFIKDRKKFISEYYYKIDGKSSKRVVDELDKLLKK